MQDGSRLKERSTHGRRLIQRVQKFSLRDFIFYGRLGLVHSDHQRNFGKADWSGGDLADGKEGGGEDQ